MKHLLSTTVLVLTMLASAGPVTVTYSSYLTDAARKPRVLSGQLVYFKLYTDSTSTTPIWQEQHGVIAPNGFISVALGSITPLPLRQIGSASALWLEMKIVTDPAFPRQKIATSFFAVAANYADSARHAVLADSAKKAAHAVQASQATLADRAIISDTAEYARGGSAVVSAQKADSAGKAGFAVQASLASRATISDTAEYARGGLAVINAQKADSARKAGNSDSLGGLAAGRYVRADTNGFISVVGTSASVRFNRDDPVWGPSIGLYRQNSPKWLLHGGYNGTDRFTLVDSSANERLTVLQNGNVGLGSASPEYPLTLMRDGIQLGSSDARTIIKMVNSSDLKGLYLGYNTTGSYGGLIAPVSGPLEFWTYSGGEWKERLRIAENGNIGIGTTAPAGLLSLRNESDNACAVERFERTRVGADVQDGDLLGVLDFFGQGSSSMRNAASIEVKAQGNPLFDTTPGKMCFLTTPAGSSQTPVERMVIDKDGKVGIGTPSPTSKLQVTGLLEYADNATALAAGLTIGALYRTGDVLKVVH